MAKRYRIIRWIIIVIALSLLGTGGIMVWLVRTPPTYWTPVEPQTPEQVEQMEAVAVQFENRVPDEFTRPRADGEIWTTTLTQDEINAWINTRMDKWLRNQREWLAERNLPSRLPAQIKRVQAGITAKVMALAAQVEEEGKSQIVSLEVSPVTGPNNVARLRIAAIKGGRLPLPRGILESLIEKFGSEEKARTEAARKMSDKLEETDLIIPLGGGRRVHILKIELHQGAANLTCQTFSEQAE
jgi:hypothetical protein